MKKAKHYALVQLAGNRGQTDALQQVRKTAMREVKLLQSIRHDNVICLLDVFHVRRRLYLVFEYIEGTVLQVERTRVRQDVQSARPTCDSWEEHDDLCHPL